jgi:carbamoyl-phosphate synthase large subunit
LLPPRPHTGPDDPRPIALVSIADRDKPLLPRLAAALVTAGYAIAATEGTRATLAALGYASEPVAKLASAESEAAGVPDMIGRIESGRVRLVVNTPTPRSGPIRDAAEIRHAAIAEGVLCLTAIETAIAAAEALDPQVVDRIAEVRSLAEWIPNPRQALLR